MQQGNEKQGPETQNSERRWRICFQGRARTATSTVKRFRDTLAIVTLTGS